MPGKTTQLYETHLGVETLPSGGQFSEKSGKTSPSSGEIVFKLFSNFSFQIYSISSISHLLNLNLKKLFFLALPSPAMVSFKSLVQLESVCFLMAKQTIKMSVIKLIAV